MDGRVKPRVKVKVRVKVFSMLFTYRSSSFFKSLNTPSGSIAIAFEDKSLKMI